MTLDEQGGSWTSRLATAKPGDWLEVHQIGGGAPRRGQILEVLGTAALPHFRIRWSETSETLHYPAEGDRVIPRARAVGRRVS